MPSWGDYILTPLGILTLTLRIAILCWPESGVPPW